MGAYHFDALPAKASVKTIDFRRLAATQSTKVSASASTRLAVRATTAASFASQLIRPLLHAGESPMVATPRAKDVRGDPASVVSDEERQGVFVESQLDVDVLRPRVTERVDDGLAADAVNPVACHRT